jgi:hypothetical protein
MRLADVAWHEVDAKTIRNCWGKAAILPETDSDSPAARQTPAIPILSLLNPDNTRSQNPIANAEEQVKSALDELESTGVLQTQNRMDISELLNPADEEEDLNVATDEEICDAVLVA